MSPLPTATTNNYHTSSLYSIGRLRYHEDLCCLKPSVLKNQEKAVDPQVGLTFQRSGSSHWVLGTPKGWDLGCWGMELKRGSQKLRPWILGVSQHHWGEMGMSWVHYQERATGYYPHVGTDLGNYGLFILSSFCKAHFYEWVQPAGEYYIHHRDRTLQGLGLR